MRPIDADALHEEISKWPESVMYKDWVQSAIANAPTIAPPPNDPLTLEELREMDGEPVWVHGLCDDTESGWHILERTGPSNARQVLHYESFGRTWLAYRRKPEEAAP